MDRTVTDGLRTIRGRGATYRVLLAPVVALFLLGLVLPFAFGDQTDTTSTNGNGVGDLGVLGAGDGDADLDAADGDATTTTAVAPGDAGPAGTAQPVPGAVGTGISPTGEALGSSDVGVSPQDVKVAVFVPNLGGFSGAGFAVNLGDSKGAFDAFFGEVNRTGGINGRRVVPSYIDFDPLNDSTMRAACLRATEDQKVFATFNINGFYGPGILCVAEEHRTPFVQAYYSDPDEWYRRSNGMYITAFPSKSRALRNLVHELDARGALRGKTIGVVDTDHPFDKSASETALLPTLARLGYTVAHRSTLSSDTATSQAQIPLEVQRMQSAGVDTVFFAGYFVYATTWVQQASNRLYFPQYLQSDFANGTSDAATEQMPSSYDGAIGVTSTRVGESRLGRPRTPEELDCLRRWKAAGGAALEPNEADETIMLGVCGSVDTFVRAARSAGANLTRTRLRDGFTGLGQVRFPLLAPFSWVPGKTDGGDQVRLVQWHDRFQGEQCKCWIPVDDFHAARG